MAVGRSCLHNGRKYAVYKGGLNDGLEGRTRAYLFGAVLKLPCVSGVDSVLKVHLDCGLQDVSSRDFLVIKYIFR